MFHRDHSPTPAAAQRRTRRVYPGRSATEAADSRWRSLTLVQQAREQLGISDREIAVLRGLLSLLPATAWGGEMIIFASNRVLSQRCDSAEERTLRRRIARLEAAGLIARRQSPNGKRYRVMDEAGAPALTYGIDLAPLAVREDELAALADQASKEALRVKLLRARIRDRLNCARVTEAEDWSEARLALRRKLSAAQLEAVLNVLDLADRVSPQTYPDAKMSGRSSQNVRHIQKSDKDISESESNETEQLTDRARDEKQDLSLDECLNAAPSALEFTPEPIRSWQDLMRFTDFLAPSLGLEATVVAAARQRLGEFGTSLAILGITEAIGRIRRPSAYLAGLCQSLSGPSADYVRMFRSLTRKGSGASVRMRIPG